MDGTRTTSTDVPAVAFRAIFKIYPNGTVALDDVSFGIRRGSIHAVCGENGAGKSTLMKILFGLEPPTSGEIAIDGVPIGDAAGGGGIGMVHQHFSLVPTLTVTENIVLGREPRRGPFIDRVAARHQVETLCRTYGLAVDPDAVTGKLSVAAQQKVEILKALARDTRILILDEPTAVLSPPEIDELFVRLRGLRDGGMTILFISHKLKEVRALAESVTVLRGGRLSGTSRLDALPDEDIMQMVMGRRVDITRRVSPPTRGPVAVSMRGVALRAVDAADRLTDIDLTIAEGEIVGIAGVDGGGQRGLVSLLSGLSQPDAGEISFRGDNMAAIGMAGWRRRGLAYLPADRFSQGGSPALTLAENAIAGTDGDPTLQCGPFLRRGAIAARVRSMILDYSVRSRGIGEPLDSLSGGNAQKLIAARELATEPRFLIADQPTRGIDVASSAFLHRRIIEAAERGAAVLLVTADLDELLRLADRIVVLFAGRITAELANGPNITPETLGPAMLGLEAVP